MNPVMENRNNTAHDIVTAVDVRKEILIWPTTQCLLGTTLTNTLYYEVPHTACCYNFSVVCSLETLLGESLAILKQSFAWILRNIAWRESPYDDFWKSEPLALLGRRVISHYQHLLFTNSNWYGRFVYRERVLTQSQTQNQNFDVIY